MNLADLCPGEKARIVDLSGVHGFIKRRLLDLGAREGAEIRFRRALPFGGPCMVESGGGCIGLRRREAARIGVKRL